MYSINLSVFYDMLIDVARLMKRMVDGCCGVDYYSKN